MNLTLEPLKWLIDVTSPHCGSTVSAHSTQNSSTLADVDEIDQIRATELA